MKIDWRDLAHYGAASIAILVGGISELGVHIPGVDVSDPKLAIMFGLGILGAGLKGGLTSAPK